MRNYKQKMDQYRLPKQRIQELREYCLLSGTRERESIETAAVEAAGDCLSRWLYKHVVSTDYSWARMEADCLPCSRDTFRLYRTRFYYILDQILGAK